MTVPTDHPPGAPDTHPGPATDADVAPWVAGLGLPGLADIHVHFLPDRVLTKVWDYFDAHGWSRSGDWPIRYRLPEAQRLAAVRALGLRAIPALTYAHKPGMAAWLNQWCADFAHRVPDAVHCGTFFPEPEAATYVPEALERGARLFKTHVTVGDFAPDDPLLDAAWSAVQDAGVPVVLHADQSARVVFFDLDGCLVDSTVPIRRCLDAAFADHDVRGLQVSDVARTCSVVVLLLSTRWWTGTGELTTRSARARRRGCGGLWSGLGCGRCGRPPRRWPCSLTVMTW